MEGTIDNSELWADLVPGGPAGLDHCTGSCFSSLFDVLEPPWNEHARRSERKCSIPLAVRASSKPQRLEHARENSLFEPLRSARARNCSKRMLEEAVEAAVEDASKLFRSR